MLPEIAEWWSYTRASREQFVQALEFIPADLIAKRPAEGAPSALEIGLHVCNANRVYCRMILEGSREIRRVMREECPDKESLLLLVDQVHAECEATLEQVTPEMVAAVRAPSWGSDPYGPLTTMWFVRQFLRHTYYHVGQINYLHFVFGLDRAR